MTERDHARRILAECRDLLVQRLVERVLEYDTALLDDARGDSFSGEIDSLQEQVGTRLQAVNQLLSLLPADEPMVFTTETHSASDSPLPTYDPEPIPRPEPATFQIFVREILADDLAAAGLCLESLLGLSQARGQECAQKFADQVRNQPGFLSRAMGLRSELANGSVNNALELLTECFGLDGLESAVAWRRLTEQQTVM